MSALNPLLGKIFISSNLAAKKYTEAPNQQFWAKVLVRSHTLLQYFTVFLLPFLAYLISGRVALHDTHQVDVVVNVVLVGCYPLV